MYDVGRCCKQHPTLLMTIFLIGLDLLKVAKGDICMIFSSLWIYAQLLNLELSATLNASIGDILLEVCHPEPWHCEIGRSAHFQLYS